MAARQIEGEAPMNDARIQPAGRHAREGHRRGRPGQASKARNQDKFRSRINHRQAAEDRSAIEQRYGLQEEGAVEKLFTSVECGESSYAVLIPVSTRGIGFASVLEHQRFSDDSMDIHAYYRVMLHLFQLEVVLSYRSQTVIPNRPFAVIPTLPADETNVLMSISQVPLATYTILHNVGAVHTPDDYYPVLRYPPLEYEWDRVSEDDRYAIGTQWAISLNVSNIREILLLLSDPITPLDVRNGFIDHCPIPGAQWINNLLMNADDIYPDNYDYTRLSYDVRLYQLLLSNASNKVYKPFFLSSPGKMPTHKGPPWKEIPIVRDSNPLKNLSVHLILMWEVANGSAL
ncbi:hypothetical protein RUM43_015043 [Polyplax serrata]|uniref:Uncharacterized protein n=1 Tax=Polyplax serrata TaxID=468196 RepID=A0AAN8P0T4_POLSC